MNILINHCWCSDSIWGGMYDCKVILSIDYVPEGKGYYDGPTQDWKNLIEKHQVDLVEDRGGFSQKHHSTNRLKPEVFNWLVENVKDRDGDEWEGRTELSRKRGWAIGTDLYNAKDSLTFSIFFERVTDARKFIKRWSVHGKPVDYFNYFRDIRWKLDETTNKLKKVA